MSIYRRKEKRYDDKLENGQYWATIQLGDGMIRVIKSKSKVYPKGY